MSKLFIVESPNKVKKISAYLGKDYRVIATKGHIFELPHNKLSVDIDTFEPTYVNIKRQSNIIKTLKHMSKKSKEILIATDPDREGEAIGFHVIDAIGNPKDKIKRVVFNSISKNEIQKAVRKPTEMNLHLYHAAKSRRVLDRLIGYMLSPIAWKTIGAGTSIGRCQTPALNITIENGNNVMNQDYTLHTSAFAKLDMNNIININKKKKKTKTKTKTKNKNNNINDDDNNDDNKSEIEFLIKTNFNETDSEKLPDTKTWFVYKKDEYSESNFKYYPPKPFITSTIQQTMNKQNHWSPKKTMSVLQSLFTKGYITYIRTDSFAISPEFSKKVKEMLNNNDYKTYTVKAKNINSQEGHEAIRPTNIDIRNLGMDPNITRDEKILYKKIWIHSVACHMKPSEGIIQNIVFEDNYKHEWKSTNHVYTYYGWKKLFSEENGDDVLNTNRFDTTIFENDHLVTIPWSNITLETKPYNYKKMWSIGDLLKKLTELGIGRPSTFSTICDTIINRCYLEKGEYSHDCKITRFNITPTDIEVEENIDIIQKNVLIPTDLGKSIYSLSSNYMNIIMNTNYTIEMENRLDNIAKGNIDYIEVCRNVYTDILKMIEDMKPQVDNLIKERKLYRKKIKEGKEGKKFEDDYFKYTFGRSKFGFYVCRINKDTGNKQYETITEKFMKSAKLEHMQSVFMYPYPVKTKNYEFVVKKGRYGLFVEYTPLDSKLITKSDTNNKKKGKNRKKRGDSNKRTVSLTIYDNKSPMELTDEEWDEWAFKNMY
jgi:DNA topoisomerase-1